MELFKIAWRNLWRSRTRTILTSFVVFFVVILSITMSSQQYGMYDNMIDNVIEFTGHFQIQDSNYINTKSINEAIEYNSKLSESLGGIKYIEAVVPRLESFSLASFGEKTKGVLVMGIDTEKERNITKFDAKLSRFRIKIDSGSFAPEIYEKIKGLNGTSYTTLEGMKSRLQSALHEGEINNVWSKIEPNSHVASEYLKPGDSGALVGEALAKYLNIQIGDTLVMISQGYHGASAADLFTVRGFVKLPMAKFEQRIVIVDIARCQGFYSANNMVTSVLVKIDHNRHLEDVRANINKLLPAGLQAQSWGEMQPETVQMIESDKAGGVFMKAIFYMIVGFIIFGTIMMMLQERKREFGILIAIGLQRSKLAIIMLYETLLIAVLGTLLGFIISMPIIRVLNKNPIPMHGEMAQMMQDYGFEPVIFFSANPKIFYTQAIVIFVVSIAIFMFPLIRLGKLNIIRSIRG